jgi:hypothetical protein
MKTILLSISLIALVSCGNQKQSGKETEVENNTQKQEILEKEVAKEVESISENDSVMTVRKNYVIFFWPDSKEIEKMQADNSEHDYNEIVADMVWYTGIAEEVLDSLKINNTRCDSKFLVLVKSDLTEIKLERKETNGDMIFFNVDKDPIISSAISFDSQVLRDYFDIK